MEQGKKPQQIKDSEDFAFWGLLFLIISIILLMLNI
jgi:hypothetical protein